MSVLQSEGQICKKWAYCTWIRRYDGHDSIWKCQINNKPICYSAQLYFGLDNWIEILKKMKAKSFFNHFNLLLCLEVLDIYSICIQVAHIEGIVLHE